MTEKELRCLFNYMPEEGWTCSYGCNGEGTCYCVRGKIPNTDPYHYDVEFVEGLENQFIESLKIFLKYDCGGIDGCEDGWVFGANIKELCVAGITELEAKQLVVAGWTEHHGEDGYLSWSA